MSGSLSKLPYRADHVGSLIRPDRLLAAREQYDSGKIDIDQLRDIEDDSIREAVDLQEQVGLRSITDGEFRRRVWYADFLTGFDNVTASGPMLEVAVGHDAAAKKVKLKGMAVTGRLQRSKPIQGPSFDFLKAATTRTSKVCIPSPSMLHFRGGREAIDKKAYPDMELFWDDVRRAYRAEIDDLVAHGLTYLQFDDTNLAYLCDDKFCAAVRAIGEDPVRLPATYCKLINDIIDGLPGQVTTAIHLCRGNARASGVAAGGVASGGYDPVSDALLGGLNVDGYFLEYDDERSGDFSPLRYVTNGKKVVLGLISTKNRQLESKDDLKHRIDEAAKVLPLEQLCLSPQCGFSSGVGTKALSIDDEKKKLTLLVETATEVWGTT